MKKLLIALISLCFVNFAYSENNLINNSLRLTLFEEYDTSILTPTIVYNDEFIFPDSVQLGPCWGPLVKRNGGINSLCGSASANNQNCNIHYKKLVNGQTQVGTYILPCLNNSTVVVRWEPKGLGQLMHLSVLVY